MLTDTAIQRLKPRDKPYREADRDGLYLLIEPSGIRKWQFRFTWEQDGKKTRPWQSLGKYPTISLKKARSLIEGSRSLLAEGINPIEHSRQNKLSENKAKLASQARDERIVFKDCYDEYCLFKTTAHGSSKPAWQYDTLQKHNIRFNNFVLPMVGDSPVEDLTESDLRDILLAIQAHGTLVNRNKVRTVFNGLFDYAAGKGYIKNNIAKLIPDSVFAKHEPKNFKHVTTAEELTVVIKKLKEVRASFEVVQALRLALLVFMRPANVAGLKWSQVDLDQKVITIDADDMKKDREFLVPLSDQAVRILDEIKPLTGHAEFVFHSPYGTGKSISRDSLSTALRRNGITEINPHGLRHTASTILHDLGFDSDAIELQLSHVIGGVRGVYNKAQYLDKRKDLMQSWADYLDGLVC